MERVFNGSDKLDAAHGNAAWQDDVRASLSRPVEERQDLLISYSKPSERVAHTDAIEKSQSSEVRAAFRTMLDKTKNTPPTVVAETMRLVADFAANRLHIPGHAAEADLKKGSAGEGADLSGVKDNPVANKDVVTKEYEHLLARGFKPQLLVDVLTVAGDIGAVASSPEGHKLFDDLKTLVAHVKK